MRHAVLRSKVIFVKNQCLWRKSFFEIFKKGKNLFFLDVPCFCIQSIFWPLVVQLILQKVNKIFKEITSEKVSPHEYSCLRTIIESIIAKKICWLIEHVWTSNFFMIPEMLKGEVWCKLKAFWPRKMLIGFYWKQGKIRFCLDCASIWKVTRPQSLSFMELHCVEWINVMQHLSVIENRFSYNEADSNNIL